MIPDPHYNYVYFIKPVGQDGPIKVGFSHIPLERLNIMMNWSPTRLELVAWAFGGRREEMALHRKFAGFRSHCEWFFPSDDLLAGISAVKAGASIVDAFNVSVPGDSFVSAPKLTAPEEGAAA